MRWLYLSALALVGGLRAFLILRRQVQPWDKPPEPRAVRRHLLLGLVPPLVLTLFDVDLFGALWIFSLPLALIVDVVAALHLGAAVAQSHRGPQRRVRHEAVAAAVLFAALELFAPEVRGASYLVRHLPSYTRAVNQLRGTPALTRTTTSGLTAIVDTPPYRVAFPWPGGITDNWTGAVFDPTGAVMRGHDDPAIRRLFGGDLVGCHHLWGPWYVCSFT